MHSGVEPSALILAIVVATAIIASRRGRGRARSSGLVVAFVGYVGIVHEAVWSIHIIDLLIRAPEALDVRDVLPHLITGQVAVVLCLLVELKPPRPPRPPRRRQGAP